MIVSLAVRTLLDDGTLAGLDQPICDFYPEWRQGRKREITLRHLLNHSLVQLDYCKCLGQRQPGGGAVATARCRQRARSAAGSLVWLIWASRAASFRSNPAAISTD